jgi:topoisomerase-4 subunit A
VDQRFSFITDHKSSKLYFASASESPVVQFSYKTKQGKHDQELNLAEFMDVKGWKAIGNKLCEYKILKINEVKKEKVTSKAAEVKGKLQAGDVVDFDVDGQGSLF